MKKNLGNPTFNIENGLGYKTTQGYVFFYNDEICVYPNKKISNDSLEDLILKYYKKEYTGNRTNFVMEIKDSFEDFVPTMKENNVVLTSITRQIVLELDDQKNIDIYLYNGYQSATDGMKELTENKEIEVLKDDFVVLKEMERK